MACCLAATRTCCCSMQATRWKRSACAQRGCWCCAEAALSRSRRRRWRASICRDVLRRSISAWPGRLDLQWKMNENSASFLPLGAALKDILIRPAEEADFDSMWTIFQELVASGDAYYFAADTSREDCHAFWFGRGIKTWVAVLNTGRLLGMYRLLPNQLDRGSHVA